MHKLWLLFISVLFLSQPGWLMWRLSGIRLLVAGVGLWSFLSRLAGTVRCQLFAAHGHSPVCIAAAAQSAVAGQGFPVPSQAGFRLWLCGNCLHMHC